MENKPNRYKELELYLTVALIANAAIFVLYLIVSGCGMIWLKVITAFLSLAMAALITYYLYINNELARQRSLWITVGAISIFLCTLVSLVLNYPSPAITI